MFLIPSPANFERFLDYSVIGSTVLMGFFFYNLHKKKGINHFKKYFKIIIYAIILFMIILSVLSSYPSHFSRSSNHQVTNMEFTGMTWTFNNRNQNFSILERTGNLQNRFYDAIHGIEKRFKMGTEIVYQDHFGYNQTNKIGKLYEEEKYLIIVKLDRISYPELYPDYVKYWRYTPEDFVRIEMDDSVLKIYDNNEFNNYFMN